MLINNATFNCLIFHVTSETQTVQHSTSCGFLSGIQVYTGFVAVYCMNFIIFLCVTLKLFHLSLMVSSLIQTTAVSVILTDVMTTSNGYAVEIVILIVILLLY